MAPVSLRVTSRKRLLAPRRLRFHPLKFFVLLVFAAIGAIAVTGAAVYYVEIEGIRGESREPGHVGAIRALAIKYAVSNVPSDQSSAPRGPQAQFSDLVVLKPVDSSSPALFMKTLTHQEMASLKVQVCNPDPSGRVPAGPSFQPGDCNVQITLGGVVVSYSSTYSSENGLMEEIGFRYRTISVDYQNASTGAKASVGWDVEMNRPR